MLIEPGNQEAPPKIQTARRSSRTRSAPSELIFWERAALRNGNDPLGKAIEALFKKGATGALFLSIAAPTKENPFPQFIAAARVGAPDLAELWSGLKWNPGFTPELWSEFLKTGFVELTPPATMTNLESARNVVRGAFGIRKEEFLLIVRAGTSDACRGVVAFVSPRSMVQDLAAHIPLFSKVPSSQAA